MPQWLFVSALTALLAALAVFTGVIVTAARRVDGGAYLTLAFVRRLAAGSADRGELNRWAFYAHRITGAAVFGFLCLHIADVSLYVFSRGLYNNVHQVYGTPPMRVLECGLLIAVLFHTLNGLRLLVIDLADAGRTAATRMLLAVTAVTVVAGAAGSAVILGPVLP